MPYGILCKDANGNFTLNSLTELGRLAFSTIAPKDTSGSTTITGLSAKNKVAASSVRAMTISEIRLPHIVSVSGDTVSWYPNSTNYFANADSLIMVWVMD